MIRRTLLVSASALALVACQTQTPTADKLEPMDNGAGADGGVAEARVSGKAAASIGSESPPEVSLARAATPGAPGSVRHETGDVTLSFADTDIREVVKQILGDILKVNYTIDPGVHGTATLETPQPVSRRDLLTTLGALLSQNGATLVQQDGLYRVLPTALAAASPSLGGQAASGSEIVVLRYASAKDLAKTLEPFVTSGAKVTADGPRNALIVSGDPGPRQTVVELIRAFDVDLLAGQSYALFPVSSDDPAKVASDLQKAFLTEGDTAQTAGMRIIPMERVNAVLVVAQQPAYIEDARRLFAVIDQAKRDTARNWHVYYCQNSQADDLANTLQRAFTPNDVSAQPSSTNTLAPGQSGQSGSSSGFQNSTGSSGGIGGGSSGGVGSSSISGTGSSTGGLGSLSQGSSQPQPAAASPVRSLAADALSDSSGSGGSTNTNAMRIISNRQNNAILIYATPEEESTIEALMHKIDILPLQVRIDATIAEVTLNDTLQYGTQFFFKSGGLNGALSSASNATETGSSIINPITNTFPGFVLAKNSSAVQWAITALQAVTDVRVLSSPQILVVDNQPAHLQVGNLVPYLTQSAQSTLTTDSPVVNSIGYQETGVILDVVPRVNSTGLVTLDVSQEVSDVASETSAGGIQSPTFLERKISSRIAVQDGQTIGLAGLIKDNVSVGNSGIPFLKDIPALGNLFTAQNNTRTRTELLVLITPHVVHDQRDARALTEDLRQKLIHAGLVPQQLRDLPLSGSPNPNGF
jgi:general secretion pathway protein D